MLPRRVSTEALLRELQTLFLPRYFGGSVSNTVRRSPLLDIASLLVSIIIRTLNEDAYLGELLEAIDQQKKPDFSVEIVIVDSGSTDNTLEIAEKFGARITTIKKEHFTFGRSLNEGCEFALGELFVLISGHCVPTDHG